MERIEPTVTLSEPVMIPEQYRDTILQFIQALWSHYAWHMREQFGFHSLPPTIDASRAMITDTLAEIALAATGEITDEDALAVVYEGIQGLMELLFAAPVGITSYQIPEGFWETAIGQMVAIALLKVRGDDLITISEAAELRSVSVPAISQAIDAHRLRAYHDPEAPSRQGRRLVSRREVESM